MVMACDDLNSGGSISRGPSEGLRMLQKESKGYGEGFGEMVWNQRKWGCRKLQIKPVLYKERNFSMKHLITAMMGAPWDKQAEMQLKHNEWLIVPVYLLVEVYLGSWMWSDDIWRIETLYCCLCDCFSFWLPVSFSSSSNKLLDMLVV